MIIKRTGNKVVDKMANISFRGDVVPSTWYSTFKDEKGKINAMALLMLANIVYWYRPTIIRDENGEVFIKRFKSDLLQRSYKEFCDMYSIGKTTVTRNLIYLEEHKVIERIFRDVETESGQILYNTMFIKLNFDELMKKTFPEEDDNFPSNENEKISDDLNFEESDIQQEKIEIDESIDNNQSTLPKESVVGPPTEYGRRGGTKYGRRGPTEFGRTYTENTHTNITHTSNSFSSYNINNNIINKATNKKTINNEIKDIINSWNQEMNKTNGQKIIVATKNIQNTISNTLEVYSKDQIQKAISLIAESNYLKNYAGGVKFDWFFKPDNLAKVLNGNYKDINNHKTNNSKKIEVYNLGNTVLADSYTEQELNELLNYKFNDEQSIGNDSPNTSFGISASI